MHKNDGSVRNFKIYNRGLYYQNKDVTNKCGGTMRDVDVMFVKIVNDNSSDYTSHD